MHITYKKNYKENVLIDHTLIIKEIEKSIKINNWEFILSFLPNGSYLVGGYIRDLILGRSTSKIDVDIVVPYEAIKIGKIIANKCNGKFIILDKEREVVRIIFKDISIDIASQTSPSINIDLLSRDFTINSIGFLFEEKLLMDPSNGVNDIELFLLKTTSEKNLEDDPLRILRCFRFISEYKFNLDPELINFVEKNKNLLGLVANERICYELRRITRGIYAFDSIQLLNKYEIFNFIQSKEDLIFGDLSSVNFVEFNKSEKNEYLPLFFLNQILDENSLRKLQFSKFEISKTYLLRKWISLLKEKNVCELSDEERFDLHKELESILPAFIITLPSKYHRDWLNRWRNKDDKLFHPSNLLSGEIIKKYIKIDDGPLLGKLINYLSIEFAFNRLSNFDETIYKGKQWIKQNAPKCD